jgi:hypothetical protein
MTAAQLLSLINIWESGFEVDDCLLNDSLVSDVEKSLASKLSDVSQVYELGKEDSLQSAGQIDKIRNDVEEIALRLRNVLSN